MRKIFFVFRACLSGRQVLCPVLCVLLCACATAQQADDIRQAELHYKIGVSFLDKNQFQEAFVKFQEAIRLNPKDKHSLNYLGYISTMFKEYDNAVSYYKRAISVDPDYSEAMNNLGLTYLEIGNWEEAIKYFQMALKNPLYQTPETAYASLGYALYKKGDYQAAESTLTAALTKYPRFQYSAYVLGLVYNALGRIDSAIEMFGRAADVAEAQWELAHLYMRTGENEKAIEQFQIIVKKADGKRSKEALKYIELLKGD